MLRSFSETVLEVGWRNPLAISRHTSFAHVVDNCQFLTIKTMDILLSCA